MEDCVKWGCPMSCLELWRHDNMGWCHLALGEEKSVVRPCDHGRRDLRPWNHGAHMILIVTIFNNSVDKKAWSQSKCRKWWYENSVGDDKHEDRGGWYMELFFGHDDNEVLLSVFAWWWENDMYGLVIWAIMIFVQKLIFFNNCVNRNLWKTMEFHILTLTHTWIKARMGYGSNRSISCNCLC
jgi:hypothetical protein